MNEAPEQQEPGLSMQEDAILPPLSIQNCFPTTTNELSLTHSPIVAIKTITRDCCHNKCDPTSRLPNPTTPQPPPHHTPTPNPTTPQPSTQPHPTTPRPYRAQSLPNTLPPSPPLLLNHLCAPS
ncbi:unnamed protein product [Cuscuta europaea]|uniref:Uncharacterized protein n=1 Tax=Cuscuta europaea TaxID=41803 RepID=A0A9P0YQQ4_CUSEU|nr:unnamed protein product [Cuscuta europaea]